MAFNINDLRSQLVLGGARPTHFQVTINNPVNPIGDLKIPFLAKGASIPTATLGVIEAPYFGRKVKLAGDRTFEEWTVTIINDEDFLIRNAIEEWNNAINKAQTNLRSFGTASPLLYKSQAQVTQFSKTGVPVRTYQFDGIWPQVVGAIELNWENNDQIEEFPVTFQYDYHEVVAGLTGNAGGS